MKRICLIFAALFTILLVFPSGVSAQQRYRYYDFFSGVWVSGEWGVDGKWIYDSDRRVDSPSAPREDEVVTTATKEVALSSVKEILTYRGVGIAVSDDGVLPSLEIEIHEVKNKYYQVERKVCISITDAKNQLVVYRCKTSRDIEHAAEGATKELFQTAAFRGVRAVVIKK